MLTDIRINDKGELEGKSVEPEWRVVKMDDIDKLKDQEMEMPIDEAESYKRKLVDSDVNKRVLKLRKILKTISDLKKDIETLEIPINVIYKYHQGKAHWKPDGKGEMVCSECNCQRPYFIDYTNEGCKIYGKQTNFCPNCGYRMIELQESADKKIGWMTIIEILQVIHKRKNRK